MTQEQKELLLKDLCSRLPYDIKVYDNNGNFNTSYVNLLHINGKVSEAFVGNGMQCRTAPIDEIRPYLFPLSSMTEEQKKDIFHNGKFYIDHHNSLCRFPMYEDDYDFVTMEDCLEIFNKLNKYHFDYRGLIEKGLALDATGLNIY